MSLNHAQLASFSLGLSSLMSMAGVYLMPQWLNTSIYFASPMQLQEPMPPMQRFPGYETAFTLNGVHPFDPSTRPGDSYEQADRLFESWRSLQGTLDSFARLSSRSPLTPADLDEITALEQPNDARADDATRIFDRIEAASHLATTEGSGNAYRSVSLLHRAAESLERIGDFDKAAMIAESAAHLHDVASLQGPPDGKEGNEGSTKYRVLAAKAWSTSVKVYRDFDRVDRFRLGRGMWNAWHDADQEAGTMRELLSASADLHVNHGDMMSAASDQLRIAWHAVEAELAPQGWAGLSSMLFVIAQNWESMKVNKGICDSARDLAEDARKLSEQI